MTARAFDPDFGRARSRRGTRANKSRTPEQQLQIAVTDWLRRCVPAPPEGPAWTAVNPVPAKSRAAAGLAKAMGLRAGWPDLQFLWRGRLVTIELKPATSGSLSAGQRGLHPEITLAGGLVTVCRTPEAVADFLADLGVPMRGRP